MTQTMALHRFFFSRSLIHFTLDLLHSGVLILPAFAFLLHCLDLLFACACLSSCFALHLLCLSSRSPVCRHCRSFSSPVAPFRRLCCVCACMHAHLHWSAFICLFSLLLMVMMLLFLILVCVQIPMITSHRHDYDAKPENRLGRGKTQEQRAHTLWSGGLIHGAN